MLGCFEVSQVECGLFTERLRFLNLEAESGLIQKEVKATTVGPDYCCYSGQRGEDLPETVSKK